MIEVRRGVTEDRNRLRKVSTRRGREGLTDEARAELDWWGFQDASTPNEVERAKAYVVGEMLKVGAGVDGYTALRAAGFELLDWFDQSGGRITATKFGSSRDADPRPDGNAYSPSDAVRWLAEQLSIIEPGLNREDPRRPGSNVATDAAYTVVQAYRHASGPG